MVTKTMSAPSMASRISSRDSSAAFLADSRVGAGAEAAGSVLADMDFLVGFGVMQCLGVGINGDELDVLDTGLNHPVDGRAAGAANPYYFNFVRTFQ